MIPEPEFKTMSPADLAALQTSWRALDGEVQDLVIRSFSSAMHTAGVADRRLRVAALHAFDDLCSDEVMRP